MPYGYLGQNTPNQTVSNSGVFDISSAADLTKQGKFGGSLELIEEQTASSDSALDFTSIKQGKYDVHLMQYNLDLNGYEQLYLRFYESGVLETASVYEYANQFGSTNASFNDGLRSTGATQILLSFTNQHQNQGYIYLYNLGNSSKYSFTTHHSFVDDSGNSRFFFLFGGGLLPQASEVDGIRIFPQTTNFTGSVKLYGVKQL